MHATITPGKKPKQASRNLTQEIEKEGLQGGEHDKSRVARHRHIHDPGIQQEPRLKQGVMHVAAPGPWNQRPCQWWLPSSRHGASFVPRKNCLRRCSANLVTRGTLHCCLLVHMPTHFDLLQTPLKGVWRLEGKACHGARYPQARVDLSPRGVNPQLDFVQLRRIAKRFSEAFQLCAWHCHHVGLLVRC